MLTIRMAWRNLWRHKRRTIGTVAAIGLGLAVLITLVSLMLGMTEMMIDQIAKSSFGHIQVHQKDYLEQRSARLVMKNAAWMIGVIEKVPGVAAASPRLIFSGAVRSSRSSSIQVVSISAIDQERERKLSGLKDKVRKGGFLALPEGAGDPDAPVRVRTRKGIMIGSRLAELLKADIGSRIRLDTAGLKGTTASAAFYVTGVVHTGTDQIDRSQVWVRLSDMQEIADAPDMVHEIAVTAAKSDIVERVASDISAALGPLVAGSAGRKAAATANVPAGLEDGSIQVATWWEVAPELRQVIDLTNSWTGILYFLMLIILSAGILTTMYMVVFERQREFGVRMALGAGPSGLFGGLMVEALLIAAMACLTGLAFGALAVIFLVRVGIDLSWLVGGIDYAGIYIENIYYGSSAPRVFIEPAMAIFLGTVLIAVWPAMKVARMRPVTAIKQGAGI